MRTHMKKHKVLIDSTNFFRQVKPELSGFHKKPDKMNKEADKNINSMCNEETVDRVQSSKDSGDIIHVETGNVDHVPTELTNCNRTDEETRTLYDKDGNMFKVNLAKNMLICNFPKEDKNKDQNMSHDTIRKSVGMSSSREENSERSQSVYTYKVDGNNVVPTSEIDVPDNIWRGNDRNKQTRSSEKYNLRKGKRKVDYAELDKGLIPESQCIETPSHVRLSSVSSKGGHHSNSNGVVPYIFSRCKNLAYKLESFHVMIENSHGLEVLLKSPLADGGKWSVFHEVDDGSGRTGVQWDSDDVISLATMATQSPNIDLKGLYLYNATTYKANCKEEIEDANKEGTDLLKTLYKRLTDNKIECRTLAIGNTRIIRR
ncbi:unnamed protein product [Mytilus coruscus]|uniref:Alanine racemase N-terminal domain-containing protein n=1 Tax=Mytilus coruscus TaxID=42192 RepID=A0A6J8CS98_MYTCO|nr:unnamed protein product [Mytilus coruscus]